MATEGCTTPDSAFMSGYMAVYFPTASQNKLRRLAQNVQASCPVENEIAGRSFFNGHSVGPLLHQIDVPTLVMHCREDAVHPLSEGMKIARGIANAELMILESRNHYPLLDEPAWQIMVDGFLEFLRR